MSACQVANIFPSPSSLNDRMVPGVLSLSTFHRIMISFFCGIESFEQGCQIANRFVELFQSCPKFPAQHRIPCHEHRLESVTRSSRSRIAPAQ